MSILEDIRRIHYHMKCMRRVAKLYIKHPFNIQHLSVTTDKIKKDSENGFGYHAHACGAILFGPGAYEAVCPFEKIKSTNQYWEPGSEDICDRCTYAIRMDYDHDEDGYHLTLNGYDEFLKHFHSL